jgi:surface antigen
MAACLPAVKSRRDMTCLAISSEQRGAKSAVAMIAVLSMLVGCANAGAKTGIGAAGGAAAGGLIGHAAGGGTAGIIGGVLLGGLLGGAVGNALDQRDQRLAQEANQQAFENARTGSSTEWRNPDSGHSGTITPTRTYESSSGQYCREFQQTVTVGGETEQAFGTACRQPDGTWKIVQ